MSGNVLRSTYHNNDDDSTVKKHLCESVFLSCAGGGVGCAWSWACSCSAIWIEDGRALRLGRVHACMLRGYWKVSCTSTHIFIHEHTHTRTHARAWMQTNTCASIRVSPDGAPGNDVDCRNAVQARAAPVAHSTSKRLTGSSCLSCISVGSNVRNTAELKHGAE